MDKQHQKIVSLLAATTEILCALGLAQNLVGRSHECDFPERVKDLPLCSEAKILPGLSSLEIDRQVKDILTGALSVYSVDKEKLKSLNPDVILTQTQCEVCAVSLNDVETALDNLLDKQVDILSVQPNTLADIFNDIKMIAAHFEVSERGDTLLEELNERLDIVKHKLKFITDKPTVACIEWIEPLMLAGNWIPELIDIAGGKSILTENGKHSPFVSTDDLVLADPEIIVVTPCGFGIERSLSEIDKLLQVPGFTGMRAVKNNRFYIADGNHYFNRSGPRVVDTVEILAEIINPKQFIFGYEGAGWIKFSV